jgi:transcriptional regulator with XRE-family HTH domain
VYTPPVDLQRLGTMLKERREFIGLTRGTVARRVRVARNYIKLIEEATPRKNGRPSQPSRDVLQRWGKVLLWDDQRDIDATQELLSLAGHEPPTAAHTPLLTSSGIIGAPHRSQADRLEAAGVLGSPIGVTDGERQPNEPTFEEQAAQIIASFRFDHPTRQRAQRRALDAIRLVCETIRDEGYARG